MCDEHGNCIVTISTCNKWGCLIRFLGTIEFRSATFEYFFNFASFLRPKVGLHITHGCVKHLQFYGAYQYSNKQVNSC